MKKFLVAFLTIALLAAMMAIPAAAAEPAAGITSDTATPGETVTLTVSLAGIEKATSIGIMIEADEGLTCLDTSAWVLEGEFVTLDAEKAAWVGNGYVSGDILVLEYELPENEIAPRYEVKLTIDVMNNGAVAAQGLTATGVVACAHNYVATVHEPTCTALGYTSYQCEYCGDDSKPNDNYLNVSHDWSDWEVVIEPTTTMVGEQMRHCLRSGCDAREFDIVPKLPVTDGWVEIDDKWYYYENGAPKTGWLEDGGRYYYFDETGVMQTGWVKIGETWYYMEPSGARAVGWQLINGEYYYFYSSGVMKTGWLNSGGKRYFFRPDGAMATGWVQSGGNWYCMDENGAMITGWMERGGKKYYMQSNGVMVTGTVTIDDEVHQFDENGVWQGKQSQSQNGWVKENGLWYYYKNGSKATGWLKDGGKWYYMDASGVMKTGWVKDNGKWYYMNGSGAMHTGWLKLDGKWYYMNTSGAMVTGTVKIDGKTYKFNSSGVWIG